MPLALRRSRAGTKTFFACAALLAIYAVTAWFAVRTKSPTYDEPVHTATGLISLQRHDFRMDYENPPLYKYWADIPNVGRTLHIDPNDSQWQLLPTDLMQEWSY